MYPFAYQGEWGLIDENLDVVLKPSLDSILLFETRGDREHTIAVKNGKQGLLNQHGKWAFKPKYDNVMTSQYYVNHLRWVLQDGLYGLITTAKKKAKWVFKPQFTNVQGFLDEEGKEITPVIYDRLERFTVNYHGGYYLHKDGNIGLAYPNGRQVLPADFSKIEYIPGLLKVHHKDNYIGYATRNGKVFLPVYSGE